MTKLFLRDWRVTAQLGSAAILQAAAASQGNPSPAGGAAQIDAPVRVRFSITKTLQVAPNTMDLKITNVSPQNRRFLKDQTAVVIFEAGYEDATSVIFNGIARTVDHGREGPDWVTHIQCADGELGYRFAWVNYSFGPGTACYLVAQALAQKLKDFDPSIDISFFLSGLLDMDDAHRVFQHGDAFQGNVLFRLAQLFPKYDFSIQLGELRALLRPVPGKLAGVSSAPALDLSPATGLIGSPEHGSPDRSGRDSIIKVRALLQPKLQPGDRVLLKSAQFDGTYRAEKVSHSGDSAGHDWYTDSELRIWAL